MSVQKGFSKCFSSLSTFHLDSNTARHSISCSHFTGEKIEGGIQAEAPGNHFDPFSLFQGHHGPCSRKCDSNWTAGRLPHQGLRAIPYFSVTFCFQKMLLTAMNTPFCPLPSLQPRVSPSAPSEGKVTSGTEGLCPQNSRSLTPNVQVRRWGL